MVYDFFMTAFQTFLANNEYAAYACSVIFVTGFYCFFAFKRPFRSTPCSDPKPFPST